MKKNNNLVYIYRLNESDFGPFEHVNAIKKYCNVRFTISNFTNHDTNYFINCTSSYIEILLFQLKSCYLLLKYRNNYDIILHRVSCGDFLISFFSFLILKPYISEYNGDLIQDLIDRRKSKKIQLFQLIFNYINLRLSYRVYLVDQNLISIFPVSNSQVISKAIILNNGFEPFDLNNNLTVNNSIPSNRIRLGYLGSLAPREGLNAVIDLLENFPNKLSLTIVGGSKEEYKTLAETFSSKLNIKHYDNRSRHDALSILQDCDFFLFLRVPKSSKNIMSQGSPLKLLDYFFLKKPVIFSVLPDHQKFIDMSIGIFINDFINYLNGCYQFQFNVEQCIKFTSSRYWCNLLDKFNKFINSY
jgi:hypothetical protein